MISVESNSYPFLKTKLISTHLQVHGERLCLLVVHSWVREHVWAALWIPGGVFRVLKAMSAYEISLY